MLNRDNYGGVTRKAGPSQLNKEAEEEEEQQQGIQRAIDAETAQLLQRRAWMQLQSRKLNTGQARSEYPTLGLGHGGDHRLADAGAEHRPRHHVPVNIDADEDVTHGRGMQEGDDAGRGNNGGGGSGDPELMYRRLRELWVSVSVS